MFFFLFLPVCVKLAPYTTWSLQEDSQGKVRKLNKNKNEIKSFPHLFGEIYLCFLKADVSNYAIGGKTTKTMKQKSLVWVYFFCLVGFFLQIFCQGYITKSRLDNNLYCFFPLHCILRYAAIQFHYFVCSTSQFVSLMILFFVFVFFVFSHFSRHMSAQRMRVTRCSCLREPMSFSSSTSTPLTATATTEWQWDHKESILHRLSVLSFPLLFTQNDLETFSSLLIWRLQ